MESIGGRLCRALLPIPGHRLEPALRAQLRDGFAALTRWPPPRGLGSCKQAGWVWGGVPDGGSVTHPRAAVLTPFDQRFTVILLRGPGAYGAGGSCRRPVTKSGSNLSAATARQPTLVRSW
jgi:hypothetical protein